MSHHQIANNIDEDERRFLEDLEKAKALSLEMIALDKFKQEKLRETSAAVAASPSNPPVQQQESGSPLYARVEMRRITESSRSPSAESTSSSTSPQIQAKPRPRPGGITPSGGLVPPPIPPKRTPCSTPDTSDLINLKSPDRIKPAELDEDSFLQELDQVYPNLNLSNTRSSRQGMMMVNTSSSSQKQVTSNSAYHRAPFPTTHPFPTTPVRSTAFSTAFGESLLNQNLIDLAVDSTHPRYSILCAFDPLLSSSNAPAATASTVTHRHQSVTKESIASSGPPSSVVDTDRDCGDDPFDYFLGVSQRITTPASSAMDSVGGDSSSSISASPSTISANKKVRETIYEVLTKEQSPVKSASSVSNDTARRSITFPALTSGNGSKESTSLNVAVNRVSAAAGDVELSTFVRLVRQVRSSFQHNDPYTNAGFVVINVFDNLK